MDGNRIDALLALRRGAHTLVERKRIRLLEAVAEHGSITAASQALGLCYKTGWSAIHSINKFLPTPACVTTVGGRIGDAKAEVTSEGRRLITLFYAEEERLSRIAAMISQSGLQGEGETLLLTFNQKISTRNIFLAEVETVRNDAVEVEVSLRGSSISSAAISSIITIEAAADLDLKPGKKVLVLFEPSVIHLAPLSEFQHTARNKFLGQVKRRTDSERKSKVTMDIGGEKSITALISRERADELSIQPQMHLAAYVDPINVTLIAN
jgi:molybdate transport system regulatory protein